MLVKLSLLSTEFQATEIKLQQLLTSGHHALVGYLTESIFDKHDLETKEFLLQTAPLERLSISLCDAVTGQGNAAVQLQKLARENLFINPIDKEGKLFRYHSLFSEYLCGLLSQGKIFDRSILHKRASEWYYNNNMPVEAVVQARASEDEQFTTEVIDRSVQAMVREGQITRMLSWLTQLPKATLLTSPNLLSHLLWCQMLTHQVDEVIQTVELAKKLYLNQSGLLSEESKQRRLAKRTQI